jgi:N-acetylneuraminic acid mutarotase
MDEPRIERALRDGPPFRTAYVQRPIALNSEAGPRASRLLAFAILGVVAVAAVSGAALVGSGVIKPPALPVLPRSTASPPASSHEPQPAGWTWAATGNLREARAGNTLTLLTDGTILAAGGRSNRGDLLDAEVYDPRTASWTVTGSMRYVRVGHSATLLPDGTVLVTGGFDCNASEPAGCVGQAFSELYDPRTGIWTETGSMLQARGGHTATLLADGRVLVAGGEVGPNEPDRLVLSSAELYDPRTGAWTETASMGLARIGHTATLLWDGTVLVVGGSTGAGTDGPTSAEVYDPRTGSWTPTARMNRGSAGHTATLLQDGTVLVAGGEGLSRVELYDPRAGSWTTTGSMSGDRYGHTATMLPSGEVLVVGGAYGRADHFHLDTTELYDPSTRSWLPGPPLIDPRKAHAAALLSDGRVIVVGGTKTVTADGWVWTRSAELYGPAREDD